jgi:ABC-2 type transport system permease protein
MTTLNTFLFEFKHFINSKAKVFAYLIFLMACAYSFYTGFSLQSKQILTIESINQKKQDAIKKSLTIYDEGKKGPVESPWIDMTTPFWAILFSPTYTIKSPSPLMPLGVGQAEQYGYYKEITTWSSAYDNDMVEELANPERLINGNIDFSFLIIFLLPILLIIFTYNINGLEKDANFDWLIAIQVDDIKKWIVGRLLFYVTLLLLTAFILMLSVAIKNYTLGSFSKDLVSLFLLVTIYISFWGLIFYFLILKSTGSSSQAFMMISVWLLLCLVIPGAVHQYASIKHPPNYMTDYLDVSREETNEMYELPPDTLTKRIIAIYPTLVNTKYGMDTITDSEIIDYSSSEIINQMLKKAIDKIERQNEIKNKLITSTYWFNPVSYVQNKWNSISGSDYYAYQSYRNEVQQAIDKKIKLLVFECWDKKKVDKSTYENYLKLLK